MRKTRSIQWLKCLVIACSVLAAAYLGGSGMISVKAAEVVASGTCGPGEGQAWPLKWSLDSDGVLTISGKGDMWNYSPTNNFIPWNENKDDIKTVV